MTNISKWQSKLELNEWSFPIQAIKPEQVNYDNDCPVKDRYFVGIGIDKENKIGTIYHDRELTESDIIHELLHVKYPTKNEAWINTTERILIKINKE